MEDLDIGDLSDAVFVGTNWDPEKGWLATFVSRYGDPYGLNLQELQLRIQFLLQEGRDPMEENRALKALERQRFRP